MVLLWSFWTKYLWVPPSAQGLDARFRIWIEPMGVVYAWCVYTGSLAVTAMKGNLSKVRVIRWLNLGTRCAVAVAGKRQE